MKTETKELFHINTETCIKCSQCVKDCAFKALGTDSNGFPVMARESSCMRCQHCFAICPTASIVFDGKLPKDSLSTENLELPSAESVSNWMRVRRSVRHFKETDVPREKLERIFKALANAPTGCNARALTFTCYPNRESMAEFKDKFLYELENYRDESKLLPKWIAVPAIQLRKGADDLFFRNASGMVVISADETAPGVTTPQEDVAAACTYFEMLAQAEGIATCWCGFLSLVKQSVPSVARAIGLRETTPFYAMLFGESAVKYHRGVQRDDCANVIWKN